MKYLEYAKHLEADEFVVKWVKTTLKNYLEKNDPSTEEVEHILDFLVSDKAPKRISPMSYLEAKTAAEKWNKTLQKKGLGIEEKESDTEIVLDFKDGFKIVKLVGENAYKREGFLMRHCVAGYYGKSVEIYSLRDKDNLPHATMERNQQIKGKGNGDIHPKYVGYVVKFLEHIGMSVGDSEMLHLGYINVEKFKKDFGKQTLDQLFDGKYLPKNAKWFDKDNNEFASLEILDQVPLISEVDSELKINFDLPPFIKLSVEFLLKKSKKLLSDVLASSGNYSKLASSGNYSKLASSGNSSQLASSGYSSQLASSGNYSKLASSGNSSQLASSGNYSKLASSGNYSKLASSGDSSQLASSGNYSKLALDGEYSVAAGIGINNMAKGKKGCFLVLAEWKYDNKIGKYIPLDVQSAKIDGEQIKEDTWYKLEKGKFVEVV